MLKGNCLENPIGKFDGERIWVCRIDEGIPPHGGIALWAPSALPSTIRQSAHAA